MYHTVLSGDYVGTNLIDGHNMKIISIKLENLVITSVPT